MGAVYNSPQKFHIAVLIYLLLTSDKAGTNQEFFSYDLFLMFLESQLFYILL